MYGINARALPRFSTFAAAESYWLSKAKPRGSAWGDNERPLRANRDHHMRLVRGMDIAGKTMYSAYLYSTPLVNYYADDRVTIRHHVSQSSAQFIKAVSPFRAFVRGEQLWINAHDQYYVPDGELTIYPAGTQSMVSGAKQLFKQLLDKEQGAAIRKLLKPWITAGKIYDKMAHPNMVAYRPVGRHQQELYVQQALRGELPETEYVEAWQAFIDVQELYRMAYIDAGAYYNEPIPLGSLA